MLMDQRWISLGLFLSVFFIRFEWADQAMFLYQIEFELLFTAKRNLQNFSHPLVILPFIGQFLLLVSVIKKGIPVIYPLSATILLGLLIIMVFITGLFSQNLKIIFSTLPFIFFSILLVRQYRKERKSSRSSQGTT